MSWASEKLFVGFVAHNTTSFYRCKLRIIFLYRELRLQHTLGSTYLDSHETVNFESSCFLFIIKVYIKVYIAV